MADNKRGERERSPEEIRYEIERTRTQLDETVEAIGDRLSPGRFVDDLWERVQSEGASAITSTLRQHPIPFSLVGAGLGWLVWEQARARKERRYRQVEYAGPERRGNGHTLRAMSGAGESMREASSRVKESAAGAAHAVAEAGHDVREKTAHAAETVTDKLSGAASTAKESVSGAAETAVRGVKHGAESTVRGVKHGAEKAREGFWQMLERNPMAVGALAFGAGMASGLSAPRTRFEDERLGRYAGAVKDEAKQVVEETAEKVKDVAQEAFDAAREKGDEVLHGEPVQQMVSELKRSAEEVGKTAVDRARERGKAEDLTPEGMKRAAGRVRDRAREAK